MREVSIEISQYLGYLLIVQKRVIVSYAEAAFYNGQTGG